MSMLLIGYDLRKSGQNYGPLIDRIKQHESWWHDLDSTWFIITDLSAKQVADDLLTYMDANDKLLVLDVSDSHIASVRGLSPEGEQWFRDNL